MTADDRRAQFVALLEAEPLLKAGMANAAACDDCGAGRGELCKPGPCWDGRWFDEEKGRENG